MQHGTMADGGAVAQTTPGWTPPSGRADDAATASAAGVAPASVAVLPATLHQAYPAEAPLSHARRRSRRSARLYHRRSAQPEASFSPGPPREPPLPPPVAAASDAAPEDRQAQSPGERVAGDQGDAGGVIGEARARSKRRRRGRFARQDSVPVAPAVPDPHRRNSLRRRVPGRGGYVRGRYRMHVGPARSGVPGYSGGAPHYGDLRRTIADGTLVLSGGGISKKRGRFKAGLRKGLRPAAPSNTNQFYLEGVKRAPIDIASPMAHSSPVVRDGHVNVDAAFNTPYGFVDDFETAVYDELDREGLLKLLRARDSEIVALRKELLQLRLRSVLPDATRPACADASTAPTESAAE